MIDKKGSAGETIITIYRVILISLIALVILGTSAVFYNFYFNVRDAESMVLAKDILDCVAPMGKMDMEKISAVPNNTLLDYCKISGNLDRFYIEMKISDSSGVLKQFKQGDSGKEWVKQLFDSKIPTTGEVATYEPGFFSETYNLPRSDKQIELKILVAEP